MKWFIRNQDKISLFIAGWCTLAAIDCFGRGDWTWAAVNAFLSFINITLAND
jgi:hypothetical protein